MKVVTAMSSQPLPFLTAPTLSLPLIRHGFFTRLGGASSGLYASLNVGLGSNDDKSHVIENRRRVAATFGLPLSALVTCHQIHSNKIVTVDEVWLPSAAPQADGMVTNKPGILLGVLAADCVPVLFADREAGVIGACHSGWKGALGGVLEATIRGMVALGAKPQRLRAAIGPAISETSYEVGPEFPEPFLRDDAENVRWFKPIPERPHKFLFAIKPYVEFRLQRAGIESVDMVPADTVADSGQFFSYRRSVLQGEPDYGRNMSAITLESKD